jgi:hypothetical protein
MGAGARCLVDPTSGGSVDTQGVRPGEWVLDNDSPDPDPAPVTTIAWRLGHLHWSFAGRWEWTFGQRRQPPELLVDPPPRWPWSGSGR